MSSKKDLFLNALSALKQKIKKEKPVAKQTLQQRATNRLQELGVDTGHRIDFGDRINISRKTRRQSTVTEFETTKKFDDNAQAQYISDTKNWLLVHATDYMPQNNSIKTTAMAMNWAAPRSTVHFTLNHIVQSHMGGNWDGRPIVILSPYNDTVQENGNPVGFALVDTYFSPDADQGLKLPKSARIVHPGDVPDGLLFQIKQNETIYKSDNYNADEIKEILSIMPETERKVYNDMENGILDEQQMYDLFQTDYSGRLKKAYDLATDKKAFLSGVMAETRYQMLINFVRQMATHMTIERMGYREITDTADNGFVAKKAEETASNIEIKDVNSGNKGHSTSIYATMEDIYEGFRVITEEFSQAKTTEQIQETVDTYSDSGAFAKIFNIIADSVVKKHPVSANSVYKIFENYFKQYYTENYQSDFGKYTGIAGFDKNLDTTMKRYCEYQAKELDQFILKLKQNPEFIKIIEQTYLKKRNMQNFYLNER